MPAVVLKLSCSIFLYSEFGPLFNVCRYFLSFYRLSFCWLLGSLAFLLLSNFRTLAKIVWPHMCQFICDSFMVHWCPCFVAGRTLFWLLWHSYVFWKQSLKAPLIFALKIVFFFGFLLGYINISILVLFSIYIIMSWDFMSGLCCLNPKTLKKETRFY